jgi:two-component system sensor histidine kinase DegS
VIVAPYTPNLMDMARERTELRGGRFDGLHAEAKAVLAYAGNTLGAARERYREAYREELARWQSLRDELDGLDDAAGDTAHRNGQHRDAADLAEQSAAELGHGDVRSELDGLNESIGRHERELNRLELAQRTLENTWLFLERGDATLITGTTPAALPTEMALRIVEAQEAERSRLAQEVHDGPAQALTNAIFQVEYVERVLDHDSDLARTELRFLRQLLRRELGDVRTFMSQLRPRVLDQLGLEGSIRETVENANALTGLAIQTDLTAPGGRLNDAEQTVVLRLVQEALQNIRKHAMATRVTVGSRVEDDAWVLEIRDDGRGFDVEAVAARGRRNFGLQFMRERAELIGARFEVRSRPDAGTVVWLAIPLHEEST